MIAYLRRRVRAFADARRGTVLIEFAILAPVMILLFMGGYQLCEAITCKRKVMIATRAVADLTSQYTTVTNAQLDQFLNASTQIMAPYAIDNAQVRVTQITVNAAGIPLISWSRALNTTTYKTGDYFNLPLTMRQPNMSYILAETSYNYEPGIGELVGNISYNQQLYMLPRASSSVVLTS